MHTYPSSSVEAARKALAEKLREIRRDAGLTARQVAAEAGWHESKSSRLENAVTIPSEDDIRAWCRICGAETRAADLIAASRSTDSMYVEWKRLQRTGMRRLQDALVPLFERTRLFRVYSSNVVPGLLQTVGYAGALLSDIADFHGTPNDAPDAAQARMDRSYRVLQHGDHRFGFVIEEAVLRYRLGDVDTMAGQLGHLLSVMSLPSVSLGVIPFTAARRVWTVETFSIYDSDQVQVELLTANVKVTAPTEVAYYVKAFSEFTNLAVYGAQARALITAALDSLE